MRARGSFLTGSASPQPHTVLPRSWLGLVCDLLFIKLLCSVFHWSLTSKQEHVTTTCALCMILKRHKQRRFHSASPRRCLEFSLPRLGLDLSASALPRLCLDKTALSSSLRFTCFRIYFIAQFYTDCAVTVTANFVLVFFSDYQPAVFSPILWRASPLHSEVWMIEIQKVDWHFLFFTSWDSLSY